jgi:hypothetical protein
MANQTGDGEPRSRLDRERPGLSEGTGRPQGREPSPVARHLDKQLPARWKETTRAGGGSPQFLRKVSAYLQCLRKISGPSPHTAFHICGLFASSAIARRGD